MFDMIEIILILVFVILGVLFCVLIKAGDNQIQKHYAGNSVQVTMLSLRKKDEIFNGKNIIEMKLKVESEKNNETWFCEKYIALVEPSAVDAWQAGLIYQATLGVGKEDVIFNYYLDGKPILA